MIDRNELLKLPEQQSSPQLSDLDNLLLTEVGTAAMEHKFQEWRPNDQLDSRAMVAGFGTKAFIDAAKAAKAAAAERLALGETEAVRPTTHLTADQLRTGEMAVDPLDVEIGMALDEHAATSAEMPVQPNPDIAAQEAIGRATAPVAPSPEAAGAPQTPQGDANTAADVANMNPFAEGVSDPSKLGGTTLSPEEVRAAMQQPVDPFLLNAGRVGESNMSLKPHKDPKVKQLLDLIAQSEGGYKDMPQRQRVTHEETQQLAESRHTLESILKKPVSEKWSTGELALLNQTINEQADELNILGKHITDIEKTGQKADDELLASFSLRLKQLSAAQKTLSGELAYAGRLLNSTQAFGKTNGDTRQYYKMVANSVEAGGGRDAIIEHARLFSGDEPLAIDKALDIARGSLLDRTIAAAYQIRYNLMLSSVRTHAANLLGSQIIGTTEMLLVKPIAGAINFGEFLVREVVPNMPKMKPEERIMFFQELPTEVAGLWAGMKEGIVLAKKIATGEEIPVEGKFISEMGAKIDPLGAEGGIVSRIGSLPTRLLEAADAFNKTVFYRAKLNQLAMRQSRASADSNKAFNELLDNPPDWIHDEAMEYAQRLTLTNDPNAYGSLIGGMAKTLSTASTKIPAFKVIVPFINTPANSMGYAFNTIGVGQLLDITGTYKIFTEGSPAQRAELLSRMTIAAGLWAFVYPYWQEGKITGAGSVNPDVRRAYEPTGWKENSILVDGKYYQLSRLDPLGMSLILMAGGMDAFHNQGQQDKFGAFMATMVAALQISKDRSSLSGLADFIEIIDGKGSSLKVAESFVASQAASFVVPNFLRDLREATDPYRREMAFDPSQAGQGILDRFEKYVQNAVPVLSKNLPPAIDANGDYIKSDGSALWRGIVPIKVSSVKDVDPVAAMYLYHRTPIRQPDYLISVRGTPIQINTLALDGGKGWLYQEYQKMVGKARHDKMIEFLESDDWKKLAEEGDYGQGSTTEIAINGILADGLDMGKAQFLAFISSLDAYQPNIEGVPTGAPIPIITQYREEDLAAVAAVLHMGASEAQKLEGEDLMNTGLYRSRKKKKSQLNLPPEQQRLLDQATGGDISF